MPDGCNATNPRPELPPEREGHIFAAHGYDTAGPGDGRFGPDVEGDELESMLDEAFCHSLRELGGGNVGPRYRYDLGRPIGQNGAGNPSTTIEIIVNSGTNQIWTAYPV